MTLTGKNLIAGTPVDSTDGRFAVAGPLGLVDEASPEHIDAALEAADRAFHDYRKLPSDLRADLLEQIAVEIESIGDDLARGGPRRDGAASRRAAGR